MNWQWLIPGKTLRIEKVASLAMVALDQRTENCCHQRQGLPSCRHRIGCCGSAMLWWDSASFVALDVEREEVVGRSVVVVWVPCCRNYDHRPWCL